VKVGNHHPTWSRQKVDIEWFARAGVFEVVDRFKRKVIREILSCKLALLDAKQRGLRKQDASGRLIFMNKSIFPLAFLLFVGTAGAQVPSLYQGADLKLGEKLIADNKCAACHQQKVGGDGSAIYRPAGRINTAGALRGMVEQCNTMLNLGLFPDEVNSIAAVLNRDHYRFK
jgi:hypothetical protein